jgi:dihydroorotate dehydrogenase (NAD+) catalytic subunit
METEKISLGTQLFGYQLDNPIIPASGTFGFGYEFADYYDINILGSISLKGTTKEARYGNPLPRIAECPSGMINAIGLQNPGVEKVRTEELSKLKRYYSKKVIANVGGHSFEEYVYVSSAFNDSESVLAVELNVSCPNVKGGGLVFGNDPEVLGRLVKEVKKSCTKPLIVKLSPNVKDISEMAISAESNGADGISAINTLLGMRIDLKTRKPVISVGKGGYSGKGVFPIAVKMVNDIFKAVSIPIIGMGGISSSYDVIEMMMAGARCVMVGTANLIDPYACKEIIEELPITMKKLGICNLSEIVGCVSI